MVEGLGETFTIFDDRTQDSGHVSYGVEAADGRRRFAKTSGASDARHPERVSMLLRAAELQVDVEHPGLVRLESVIEVDDGVVVVYDWFNGELLNSPRAERDHPDAPGSRFRALPAAEIAAALDVLIDLHVELEAAGWVSGDLYDGCLMYDFDHRQLKVIDFECYRRGTYVNDVGRMFGSTRFMAPEEFTLGCVIDSRTTVYNLGRMLAYYLPLDDPHPDIAAVVAHAVAEEPQHRPQSLAAFQAEWRRTLQNSQG